MLDLGTHAPDFELPEPKTGQIISLESFNDYPALLVIFMCNHCPYVKHIGSVLAKFAQEYRPKGLATVGINANDVQNYPDDNPEKMVEEAKVQGYAFPYVYDESQKVAKAYKAACTPDFFLFDKSRKLVYRGQFDDSRPGNNLPVTGKDLSVAVDAVLNDRPITSEQRPSVGCNIKWKRGNEPDYLG
jgi:thiol-disulfide isomerase/thioredoxin